MRIAVLEPYIEGIGGAQKVIAEYVSFLLTKGHKVEIFTQRYSLEGSYPLFRKTKINLIKPVSKMFSPIVFFKKKYNGFDVVIANDFPSNLATIRNKRVLWVCYSPKRYLYDLKEFYLGEKKNFGKILFRIRQIILKPLDKISARRASIITVASNNVQKRVNKYYKRKAILINHGIHIEEYKQGKYKPYFVSVSRLITPKRVDMIVKAMAHIKTKGVELHIIGSGPELNNIKQLSKKLRNIKFLGEVSQQFLINQYANCTGLIYVPIDEDWGLAPLEAAASGKLTIGCNEGGLKETIKDKETGFLIDCVDELKIADKIDFLMKNKGLAQKMGLSALENVKKFDWRGILPKFEEELFKISRLKNV